MTTLEILKAARALIEKPERWTRDYYAKWPDSEQDQAHAIRRVMIKILTHELDEWLSVRGKHVVEPHP